MLRRNGGRGVAEGEAVGERGGDHLGGEVLCQADWVRECLVPTLQCLAVTLCENGGYAIGQSQGVVIDRDRQDDEKRRNVVGKFLHVLDGRGDVHGGRLDLV